MLVTSALDRHDHAPHPCAVFFSHVERKKHLISVNLSELGTSEWNSFRCREEQGAASLLETIGEPSRKTYLYQFLAEGLPL